MIYYLNPDFVQHIWSACFVRLHLLPLWGEANFYYRYMAEPIRGTREPHLLGFQQNLGKFLWVQISATFPRFCLTSVLWRSKNQSSDCWTRQGDRKEPLEFLWLFCQNNWLLNVTFETFRGLKLRVKQTRTTSLVTSILNIFFLWV